MTTVHRNQDDELDSSRTSTEAADGASGVGAPSGGVAHTNTRRAMILLLGIAGLAVAVMLSTAIGSKNISFGTVINSIVAYDVGVDDHVTIRSLRVPRTVLAILVGVAMGVAGALIQAITRNPLADPGILGVNAGAAFFVAVAVSFFGIANMWGYIWFAFAGAMIVALAVYLLGSAGRGGATPVRLTLAGVAIGAVLSGITTGITLLHPRAFDELRYWNAGSIVGRGIDVAWAVAPFIVIGVFIAILIAQSLNAVALGEDLARSLGANVNRTRVLGVIAVTLLCGAGTAAAGPIGFVGLMVPHVARWIVGPDQRWILAYTVVGAPLLMLLADVTGRLIVRPDEMPVGIVTAFIGAPVLILLVRRTKASGL